MALRNAESKHNSVNVLTGWEGGKVGRWEGGKVGRWEGAKEGRWEGEGAKERGVKEGGWVSGRSGRRHTSRMQNDYNSSTLSCLKVLLKHSHMIKEHIIASRHACGVAWPCVAARDAFEVQLLKKLVIFDEFSNFLCIILIYMQVLLNIIGVWEYDLI